MNDKLTTKEKIFRTAVELFGTKGYDSVSIRNITGRVGIRESSFYNHFKSKQQLFDAIVEKLEKDLNSRDFDSDKTDEMIEKMTPVQIFRKLLDNFIEFWSDPVNEKIWFVLSQEQYKNKKAAELILNETGRILEKSRRIFSRLIEKKKVKDEDPELLAAEYAYTLRAMHLEYGLRGLHNFDSDGIKKRMYEHVSFFFDKLKTGGNE